jgi:UDP-N-acetylglucosamine:LPS N-acetylglucosamine transferase
MLDADCTAHALGETLDDVLVAENLMSMSAAAAALGRRDAAREIAHVILKVARP